MPGGGGGMCEFRIDRHNKGSFITIWESFEMVVIATEELAGTVQTARRSKCRVRDGCPSVRLAGATPWRTGLSKVVMVV